MKKKIFILRFGIRRPLEKEMSLIAQIVDGNFDVAFGINFDFGVISLVETTMTPEQIAALFKKCADDTGDVLPVLVFELESPSASFDLSCFPGLSEAVAAYVSGSLTDSDPAPKDRGITKVEMSLDELLDIVNKGGIEALTSEQKELLNKLSSEL